MRSVSFYNLETGAFVGLHMIANDKVIEASTPAGCAAVEGHHDALSKRVDLATGQVIDWQPPQPSADHEWDYGTTRWRLSTDAQASVNDDRHARQRIRELEAGQHRAIRECVLGKKGAIERLQAIDDEISGLRAKLIA